MLPARELLNRCWYVAVAVAVTVFPEHLKEHPKLQPYSSATAHALTAAVEALAAAALFVWGLIRAVLDFSHGPVWLYLVHQPQLTHRDFFAMGALGYLSYLARPTTWLLLYCFAEGIVRVYEVWFSERHLGLGVVWLGWQLGRLVRCQWRQRRLQLLLGPKRPDEVVLHPPGNTVALEVFTVEDKPWSETQVVELNGAFYELVARELVPHRRWHAWRYQFLPLGENEVIRGSVVSLPTRGQHRNKK